ncbi:MAG: 7-carboxy-7-deazaguanine synthase QueE [Methylomonas sp.]|nr:7-carboxy-7-deazaguanine synthase QueE [Methylomonas sp.]PPD22451.1 MAG: 7-carboxy-7-deazaguanine synthase QueE [Methylomonas sp.]PPD25863.1 MAG: 7-carboxy-7-deazaguanine synthase QueE [Methylomonas sp.]PPD37320.1 MAG: 7-carboxy-7-deazaguanine synthase QueE [Methylomonas sp.]PPD42132.1 MAG: 7-carboxy-7-deazaguanine synthase QueE [Methylomonas sp.]
MEASLRLSEIFYSLQGETNTVGLPTVFIRLTGCPLRCGYCDTTYAFTGGEKWLLTHILDEVKRYRTRHVTVTGGEPLAQSNCLPLLDRLIDEGYQVSLETSGALDVADVNPRVVKVMDMKTPSSGEHKRNFYPNIGCLTAIDQVKFVIADDEDYRWSVAAMTEHKLAERCQVLFSPVTGVMSPTALADRILADQLPVRFQIQLHKYLWNDARGK